MGAKYINSFLDGKIKDGEYLSEYSEYSSSINVKLPQLSTSEVEAFLTEDARAILTTNIDNMYEKGIYANAPGVHSVKHIEDVMLFATIIGKAINLDNHDLQLLVEAAKYHDSARIRDFDRKEFKYQSSDEEIDKHGLASAKKAREELAGKYSEDDVKIIAIAIELHVPRVNAKLVEELCGKYKIDTKDEQLVSRLSKIVLALKDADALDRTRFRAHTREFANSDYLYLNISKCLIQVGAQINEKYAVDDLAELKEEKPELASLIDEKLELTHSPKEVIRAYRKNYLESLVKVEKQY